MTSRLAQIVDLKPPWGASYAVDYTDNAGLYRTLPPRLGGPGSTTHKAEVIAGWVEGK